MGSSGAFLNESTRYIKEIDGYKRLDILFEL